MRSISFDHVICPKCFHENDLEKLVETTSYGYWAGPEVYVNCLECEFDFNVSCEHAGFVATQNFDMESFRRVHNIKIPNGIYHGFVNRYFDDLITTGVTKLRIPSEDFQDQAKEWLAAYEFAMKEWNRIQKEKAHERSNIDD